MIIETDMDGAEIVQRYLDGQRVFRAIDVEEGGAAFRGRDLREIDLSHCIIVGDFRECDLRGAKFVNANIKTSDFRGADLRGADLSGAAICSTEWSGADMAGAVFTGAFAHSWVLEEGERPDW